MARGGGCLTHRVWFFILLFQGTAFVIYLALDPSSTCTGYAVVEQRGSKLVMKEAGVFKVKQRDGAVDRVMAMRADLLEILYEVNPDIVLVEIPLDKQYTRQKVKVSGMAVWAGAAWALWMVALDWSERTKAGRCTVVPVSNTLWTKGTSKCDRQLLAEAMFPNADFSSDTGNDASDAASLAIWYDKRNSMALGCKGEAGEKPDSLPKKGHKHVRRSANAKTNSGRH